MRCAGPLECFRTMDFEWLLMWQSGNITKTHPSLTLMVHHLLQIAGAQRSQTHSNLCRAEKTDRVQRGGLTVSWF